MAVFQLHLNGKSRKLELHATGEGETSYTASLDGEAIQLNATILQPGVLSIIVSGQSYRCILDQTPTGDSVLIGEQSFPFALEDPRSLKSRRAKAGNQAGTQTIKAPMPGRIVRVLAAPGDLVAAHQGLVVIEAMKMQNELKSQHTGKVTQICVQAGDTVAAGQPLIVIEGQP